jgi:hypothetical protein
MRRKKGTDVSVPSQWGVPHQDRFPGETAANQGWETTAIPIADINSNATFPMPKVAPANWGALDHAEQEAAFVYVSHTNGKKR